MPLTLDGVDKRYGETWALRDVNLELTDGVVGLLGPNGAGKSTLMRIVTTFLAPTEGTVRWNGTDVSESPGTIRRALGYLPQEFGVYPDLTAREFLSYLAAVRGVGSASDRIDELLALVNLADARDRKLRGYSGGMKRRVGIAQALLADPDLLVVDEPTVGLDPEERVRFRNVLATLAEDRVVLLSTHIVPDVEATATDVAIMGNGAVLAHDSPGSLLSTVDGRVWEWVVPDGKLVDVRREYTVSNTTRRQSGVRIRVVATDRPSADATRVDPTLEDAYLHAVGGEARR